jgi:hypothetical protein
MGLFKKERKERKVTLVSYNCKVEDKRVLFKVTLQNTSAEVVTQSVWLRQEAHLLLSSAWKEYQFSATLNPLETRTFEFTQEFLAKINKRFRFSVEI